MVTIIRNGHEDTSSNPVRISNSANMLTKGINPIILPSSFV